ncbi:antigen like protein [Clarias magur]|uniref:Antigen like protein n=1 Tax=Clarias magur TaxID=1594786 RepID=A0A8J4X209_CLAMG|nr:antigen like protein [Clarias magur]
MPSALFLLSAEPEISVSGPVGSTAVLPCELTSVDTHTLYIRWKIESKTVFERVGEESEHGEGYEARVDVPVEELRKRNCSLVLSDSSEQLPDKFSRISGKNLESEFFHELDEFTQRFIDIFRSKGGDIGSKLKKILHQLENDKTSSENLLFR